MHAWHMQIQQDNSRHFLLVDDFVQSAEPIARRVYDVRLALEHDL
jgi:hypothetical protein